MKKITTLVTEASLRGDKAVTFSVTANTIPPELKERMPPYGGTLTKGMRTYVRDNVIIYVDDDAYNNGSDDTPITIGIVIASSPVEKILQDMNIATVAPVPNAEQLSAQLIDTYDALGVHDWIHNPVPSGIRSIVAYRYGYTLNQEYNEAFNEAWVLADNALLNGSA